MFQKKLQKAPKRQNPTSAVPSKWKVFILTNILHNPHRNGSSGQRKDTWIISLTCYMYEFITSLIIHHTSLYLVSPLFSLIISCIAHFYVYNNNNNNNNNHKIYKMPIWIIRKNFTNFVNTYFEEHLWMAASNCHINPYHIWDRLTNFIRLVLHYI